MKKWEKWLLIFGLLIWMVMPGGPEANAGVAVGKIAPNFVLTDFSGKPYDLSTQNDHAMLILYFFDAVSKANQDGLLRLDHLSRTYSAIDLSVWGITRSAASQVDPFFKHVKPNFPILADPGQVSDLYGARVVLPMICIIGPGLKVLDTFQGGGETMEVMLVRLAERKLQQRRPEAARWIAAEAVRMNPIDPEAKAVAGYASLNAGEIDQAERVFQDLAKEKGKAEIIGKEGLAAVFARKGKNEPALALAAEVQQKAPQRAHSYIISGNLLYGQQKKEAAAAQFEKAIAPEKSGSYAQAVGFNQLGRILADNGELQKSRQLFDKAIEIDPYYIEAMSNKARTYEREGNWDQALNLYRQSLSVDSRDSFAKALAVKAKAMAELERDAARKSRMDQLVKELAKKYREQSSTQKATDDTWSSRPMILTFVDFQEKGGLAERDGFADVLTAELGAALNASGRIKVVERVLMERLLDELQLSAADLAKPETTLKLGEILAAKLIGTGSLLNLADGTILNLRLIDAETTTIPQVITRHISQQASLEKEIYQLNREILQTIITRYPLKGYVVSVEKNRVMLNLGSNQGVVSGSMFKVIEEKAPIDFMGKALQGKPNVVGRLEVVNVEPDLCYAKILKQERPLQAKDKIREAMDESAAL